MQVSIVNYKDLNFELRIDAEYYRSDVLRRISLLENTNNDFLKNLASFVIGPFGSTVTEDKYVNQSDYRYVRNKDINNFLIGTDDPAYVSEEVYKSLPQFHIHEDDLLVTVVGTLGKAAIARSDDTKSIFSCKSTIVRAKKIDPFYLLTYLNTPTGQLFILRGARGAIQQGLNLSDLREITVFIPTISFQSTVRNIVKSSFDASNKASSLYFQAEQKLLSELGLLNWKPQHELAFSRNFSDTQAAERIDAEYFQPEYDEIVKAITLSGNYARLSEIVTIKKCTEPGSDSYQDDGIPFLRVSNLSKFGVNNDNQQFLSQSLYDTLKTYQPQKGEILLSKDATPGIAFYLRGIPHKMVPSSGILRVEIKDISIVLPEFLTLVINSIIVQKQNERDAGGSVIDHWRIDQIKNTLIPIFPVLSQKQISDKIEESFSKREQAKCLLDIAKHGVEMAIETDEKTAQEWITQELTKYSITL